MTFSFFFTRIGWESRDANCYQGMVQQLTGSRKPRYQHESQYVELRNMYVLVLRDWMLVS